MKKILTVLLFFILPISMLAESTVYIFMKGYSNQSFTISINGSDPVELPLNVKSIVEPSQNPSLKVTQVNHTNSCHPIILTGEGKTIIKIVEKHVNESTGKGYTVMAETSLYPEDGETYYYDLKEKMMPGIYFKALTSKEGKKKLSKNKYDLFKPITFNN